MYQLDTINQGDARKIDSFIAKDSVALSIWSPPYHVGKNYETGVSFVQWKNLLRRTIQAHTNVLKPGGFVVVNIADILCFKDESIPRIMAENVSHRKRSDITRDVVVEAKNRFPEANRKQLASVLGCSEQTIDRRLNGNNIRGGKYQPQTRVMLVPSLLEEWAYEAGLYLYDRRVWVKDAAWENSRWHSVSYRAVDEFEHVLIFWKPGVTKVDKTRLRKDDWISWGSRAVWNIPSVRANDDHEAKFPIELPRRLIQMLSEPGDTVLDCFVGSGTTAVAAAQENRRFIGVEKSAQYVRLAKLAVSQAMHLRDQRELDLIEYPTVTAQA
jgi:DNA modification methylase